MMNENLKINDDALDSVNGGSKEETFDACPPGCMEVKEPSWNREGRKKKCDCGSKDIDDVRAWFMDTKEVAEAQICRKCGAHWLT